MTQTRRKRRAPRSTASAPPEPAGNGDTATPRPARTFGQTVWEWTKSLFIGFILFLVIRTFVLQTWTVISGSMEGTLLVGDFLVLSRSAYGATIPLTKMHLPGYSEPHRGDIVVFRGHHEPIDLVKRLIGLPGDTLSMRDAVLYIDGIRQLEPYVRHTDPGEDPSNSMMEWQRAYLAHPEDANHYHPTRDNWGPIVVPPGRFFMMGDNRDESLDSRYWGFITKDDMKGRAVALYFSWDRNAIGPLPIVDHIRWNRLGTVLH